MLLSVYPSNRSSARIFFLPPQCQLTFFLNFEHGSHSSSNSFTQWLLPRCLCFLRHSLFNVDGVSFCPGNSVQTMAGFFPPSSVLFLNIPLLEGGFLFLVVVCNCMPAIRNIYFGVFPSSTLPFSLLRVWTITFFLFFYFHNLSSFFLSLTWTIYRPCPFFPLFSVDREHSSNVSVPSATASKRF